MLASAYLTVGMCRRGKYSLMQTPAGPEKGVNCPLLKAQHFCPLNFLILPLLGQEPLSLHRCQGVNICEARTVASRLQFPTKRFTTSPWHSVSSCSLLSAPMHFLQGMHCAGCARLCATQSLLLNLGNSLVAEPRKQSPCQRTLHGTVHDGTVCLHSEEQKQHGSQELCAEHHHWVQDLL